MAEPIFTEPLRPISLAAARVPCAPGLLRDYDRLHLLKPIVAAAGSTVTTLTAPRKEGSHEALAV